MPVHFAQIQYIIGLLETELSLPSTQFWTHIGWDSSVTLRDDFVMHDNSTALLSWEEKVFTRASPTWLKLVGMGEVPWRYARNIALIGWDERGYVKICQKHCSDWLGWERLREDMTGTWLWLVGTREIPWRSYRKMALIGWDETGSVKKCQEHGSDWLGWERFRDECNVSIQNSVDLLRGELRLVLGNDGGHNIGDIWCPISGFSVQQPFIPILEQSWIEYRIS